MKPAIQSKTLWFNGIMLIVLLVPPALTLVKVIRPDWAVNADAIGAFIMAGGNAIIRVFYTNTAIDLSPAREQG